MSKNSQERRRAQRRSILESFSVFVVVPKKGIHRLPLRDLSPLGIGFDLDVEGESPESFQLKEKAQLELQFFLNQSLYLPLLVEVKRIETDSKTGLRRVGGEFLDTTAPGHRALVAFVEMLDRIEDVARLGKS
jgi:hypothetical protein